MSDPKTALSEAPPTDAELDAFEAWTYPPVGDGCDDCNLIRRLVKEVRRLRGELAADQAIIDGWMDVGEGNKAASGDFRT